MENKQYVLIIAICLLMLGMIIGLAIGHNNQPCGKIIFEHNHLNALTEEEISRKFTEWLNDNVEVTIRINESTPTKWEYSGEWYDVIDPETDLLHELP